MGSGVASCGVLISTPYTSAAIPDKMAVFNKTLPLPASKPSMVNQPFIPVCRPYLTGREKAYVLDAVESGWISSAGQYLGRFEETFANLAGCQHGISCTNGTAAVHLALLAAGVGPGDRVVVPSFTMMASVFPILQQGARPVFVDCEPDLWTLDPATLAAVKGPVKAVMPVHIYGHPADMDPINEWAREHGAAVIEDAAEAHGALYRGRPVGALGDVAAFSFYANKVLTTGEGGMVTTNSEAMAGRAAYYRNLCFDKDPAKRFIHEEVGYNYRLTNVQAAIGLAQVEQAEILVAKRRGMAAKYLERLKDLQHLIQLPVERDWALNVYWMFGIVLRDGVKKSIPELSRGLKELGVDTRRFFFPGHKQPVMREFADSVQAPHSERLWERGLYLPSSSDLSDVEADRVVEALIEVMT